MTPRVIRPMKRVLADNTQYSQKTNIHAPAKTGTLNFSKRAATNLSLRPRYHRNRIVGYRALVFKHLKCVSLYQTGHLYVSNIDSAATYIWNY
jgi:hypothetical protein